MRAAARGERPSMARRSLWLCLAGLASALSGCAGAGAGGGAGSAGASHPLLGAPAPAFELREATGSRAQSLASHAGKVVIVDFWATWCEPCRESFPAYQKLMAELGSELIVIGISQDDEPKGIARFVSDTGVQFPIVWDDGKSVAKAYDPPSMPTAFVVDKNGIVRFVHVGYRAGDEATLADEARSLMR